MKILQLVSNFYPTHLESPLAINSHVGWLSNGLSAKGNEVHLFAANDSETSAHLHGLFPSLSAQGLSSEILKNYFLAHISSGYKFAQENCDIVHSHFNLLSSFFSNISPIPTVMSVHSPITDHMKTFMRLYSNEKYISFSLAQRKQLPELNWYANIYHGVDTNVFSYNEVAENYFLYLGRITEDKGVHLAIEAAKAANVPLLIAGTSYPLEGYWQKQIEPHINGSTVRYIGRASFKDKIKLLQNAKALLFPTQVHEAFGYSMIEAMACGTPVIGWNNGSVTEIVKHGKTGYVVNSVEEMVDAIKGIEAIDRKSVRTRAELFFSLEKMVSGYEKVYKRILDEEAFKKEKRNTANPSPIL